MPAARFFSLSLFLFLIWQFHEHTSKKKCYVEQFMQVQLTTAEREWKLLLSKYRQLITDSIELRLELEACRFEADQLRKTSTSFNKEVVKSTPPPSTDYKRLSVGSKRNFDLLEEIRSRKFSLKHVNDADNPTSDKYKKKKCLRFTVSMENFIESFLKERRAKICPRDDSDDEFLNDDVLF